MISTSGCMGGARRLPVPKLNPSKAAADAFELYDKNSDGFLDQTELEASPALKKSVNSKGLYGQGIGQIDADQDKQLSMDELTKRLQEMVGSKVSRSTVACAVLMGNQPIPGVEVRFIPEPFMGEGILPATGTTGQTGLAMISDEGGQGMTFGFFRIELSKKGSSGKETIPERYNTKTELGQEVSLWAPELKEAAVVLRLTK